MGSEALIYSPKRTSQISVLSKRKEILDLMLIKKVRQIVDHVHAEGVKGFVNSF